MKRVIFLMPLLLACMGQTCVGPEVRQGQRLIAGCPDGVNDRATIENPTGEFICDGEPDPAPFAGNGRACGHCHLPGKLFGLPPSAIPALPDDHP